MLLAADGEPYEWDPAYASLQSQQVFEGEQPDVLNLHSTYVQALVTLGLPGLLLFIAMLCTGLVASWRLIRRDGLAGAASFGIIVWSIAGLFESQQIGGQKLSTLGFLLSLALLGCSMGAPREEGPEAPRDGREEAIGTA